MAELNRILPRFRLNGRLPGFYRHTPGMENPGPRGVSGVELIWLMNRQSGLAKQAVYV